MGALTHGNVRIGLAWTTSATDIDRFLAALPPIVTELRSRVGVS
jgi:cysteine desulfurase